MNFPRFPRYFTRTLMLDARNIYCTHTLLILYFKLQLSEKEAEWDAMLAAKKNETEELSKEVYAKQQEIAAQKEDMRRLVCSKVCSKVHEL